jgi:cupin 2 domain-containing protein
MNSINANIFTDIPAELPEELFECIVKRKNVQIERIVSKGHMTPTSQWYDQDWDEWVILLQGQATILYEKDMHSFTLTPGDYLLIPAHTRHRVEWTTPERHTIWLAVLLH